MILVIQREWGLSLIYEIISSIFSRTKNMDRRWRDSSVGEVFPCKHGDLSAILRTRVKNPGIVVHGCNPSTGEEETG